MPAEPVAIRALAENITILIHGVGKPDKNPLRPEDDRASAPVQR